MNPIPIPIDKTILEKTSSNNNPLVHHLQRFYDSTNELFEICIDEAGRGCLFGRVYIACVVLPKESTKNNVSSFPGKPDFTDESFSGNNIKDSKKFSSKTKINQVAEYIKQNAFAWHIAFIEHDVIDKINILQAVMRGMHECIRKTIESLNTDISKCMAIIDGNYFTPYREFDETQQSIVEMKFSTIEKGDSIYMGIAAASILAKTARDQYVLEMCNTYPELNIKYNLHKNMGYGTKQHLEGIKQHGITQWHRKTFGICRDTPVVECHLTQNEKTDEKMAATPP